MDKDKALEIWKARFGDAVKSVDFTNVRIHREAYKDNNNPNGWCIHYKQPLSKGGTHDISNIEIVSIESHLKINNKTIFTIDQDVFEVHHLDHNEYGIFLIQDDEIEARVDFYE